MENNLLVHKFQMIAIIHYTINKLEKGKLQDSKEKFSYSIRNTLQTNFDKEF